VLGTRLERQLGTFKSLNAVYSTLA